jgi:uncharacterized protein YjiK
LILSYFLSDESLVFIDVEVESDSSSTMFLIYNGCGLRHSCFILIHQIKDILKEMSYLFVMHVRQKTNRVFDYFVKNGRSVSSITSVRIFNYILVFASLALIVDASLVTFVSCFLLGLAASPFISKKKELGQKTYCAMY